MTLSPRHILVPWFPKTTTLIQAFEPKEAIPAWAKPSWESTKQFSGGYATYAELAEHERLHMTWETLLPSPLQ